MTTNIRNPTEEDIHYNVTLIGDGYVGKSSILRAVENMREKRKISMQKDSAANLHDELPMELDFRHQTIKFLLVDTAGQEEYDQIRKACYNKTSIFLLCFSVADKTSFENIQARWMPEIQPYRHVPIILIGTKTDLQPHSVARDRGRRMQKKIRASYYIECSSANGDGIEKILEYCAQILTTPPRKKRSFCSIQ